LLLLLLLVLGQQMLIVPVHLIVQTVLQRPDCFVQLLRLAVLEILQVLHLDPARG
jgi:hypothetical protein